MELWIDSSGSSSQSLSSSSRTMNILPVCVFNLVFLSTSVHSFSTLVRYFPTDTIIVLGNYPTPRQVSQILIELKIRNNSSIKDPSKQFTINSLRATYYRTIFKYSVLAGIWSIIYLIKEPMTGQPHQWVCWMSKSMFVYETTYVSRVRACLNSRYVAIKERYPQKLW